MLKDMIALCLNMAAKDKMSSIAFPTVGCGQLKYDPALVAKCFKTAERDADPAITVYYLNCVLH